MSALFTPYRADLDSTVINQLQARKSTYLLSLKMPLHLGAATRNPAYCTVGSGTVTVPEYPQGLFEGGMYDTRFKPGPLLKQCVIRSGGDFGLILEVEAEIQCNTLSDFERIEKRFLRLGKIVDVKFGYKLPRGSGYSGKTITGCRVARFSFTTTPEGFWICKFTALAPGQEILSLEVHNRVEPKSRKYFLENQKFDVSGLAELMLCHAQGNGEKALDQMQDGEVVTTAGYGAIVVYKSDFLFGNLLTLAMNGAGGTKPENESGYRHYYTLEYIVGLINKEIIPIIAKQAGPNQSAVEKFEIKFDENLSYCYTSTEIRSAYPTKILLLGVGCKGGNSGNYLASGLGGFASAGKDFEIGAHEKTTCYKGLVQSRAKIWPGNILFEHAVVMEALNSGTPYIPPSENTDVKQSDEGNLKVKEFFNFLFKQLSEATGGMIKLRLSLHPKIHTPDPDLSLFDKLFIFDENNGYHDQLKCWVFNPLAGDGTTRSCTVTSEVGSGQYQGWAVANTKKSSDPIAEVEGECKDGTTTGRNDAANEAASTIERIIYSEGALGKSLFNEVHMQAIREQLSTIRYGAPNSKKMDMSVYPGLGMDVTLDGLFGFYPGNAIFSTQVPAAYRKAKTYFMVETVENVFDGNTSDWSTSLKAKLAFHTDVQYIGG